MAIKHMKHLQAHKFCSDDTKCDLSNSPNLDHEERIRQYRLGYQECLSEAIRFLVEIEGLFTGDGLCRRMMDYLHTHMTTLQKGIQFHIQIIINIYIYYGYLIKFQLIQ